MEHQTFLQIVQQSDCKLFVDWFENASLKEYSAVKETIDRLSQKQLNGIWTVFSKWVAESNQILNTDSSVTDKISATNTLKIIAVLASYTMDNFSSSEPKGLGPAVEMLNKALKLISCPKAGEQICEMSATYWKIHVQLESSLSVNVVIWFLIQALNNKAAVKHIKNILSLKEAIERLDPMTLETSGLLRLFLSCASNSNFINAQEGRKLIAILFRFGPNVIQQLHETVKKQLPISSLTECESYGDIYFRGWKTSPEECRTDIEFVIQDLMYNAVVAIRKPLGALDTGINKIPMNKLLFHLLHAIHRQKKQRSTAILIYNLYKPILWRYLEASNGFVRANSLCLFFDSFPFETGEGVEEDEAIRQKQWKIIQTSLMDPVPLVRSVAVQGTCQILANYWEIIPVHIVKDWITCMLRRLLFDSSSSDVRASVVRGLNTMLESKLTHSLLEKMIPLTSKVLHDVHEKVRSEYVTLLIRIQSLRVSKLWEVIDVNHLVMRLAIDDSKTVCRRLVILLGPFYNPKSQPEVLLQRCLRLVIDNRAASRKFYEYAHCCMDIQQMAQLILIIWKFLRNYILKRLQQKRSRTEKTDNSSLVQSRAKKARRDQPIQKKEDEEGSSDSENGNESNSSHEDFDEATLMGLIDIICIILNGNKTKLKTPQNLVYWENIKKRFNKSCSLFFRYFRNNEGVRSMIYLYGLLSSSSSQLLYSYVKSQLKSLDDAATQKEFGHLVDVMCNWGRADDVLEFISENVLSSLDQPSKAMDTTDAVRKCVSFQKNHEEKPMLGLRFMGYLLQNPHTKKIILRQNLPQVEEFCVALKPVLAIVESRVEDLEGEQFLFIATILYVKLVAVLTSARKREEEGQLHFTENQVDITSNIEIFAWVKRVLLTESTPPALEDLVCCVLANTNNLLMVHAVDMDFCQQFVNVIALALVRFPTAQSFLLALKSGLHLLEFVMTRRSIGNESDETCELRISRLIEAVIRQTSIHSKQTPFADSQCYLMRDTLREILAVCHRYKSVGQDITSRIIAACVNIMRVEIGDRRRWKPDADENLLVSLKELPQTTGIIVSACRAKNSLAHMILTAFFETETANQFSEPALPRLYGTVRLLHAISKEQGKVSSATLVQCTLSADTIWSTISDIEKSLNEQLTALISNSIRDLKHVLKVT